MAAETRIAWTDRTHNPWWGCSSPAGAGCDRCYAATLDRRTGGNHFGIGTAPRLTSPQNRNKPLLWNRQAEASGVRLKVFCGSMMDWTDKNAPAGSRDELWRTIRATPMVDWQLLTKRAPNISAMLPADWGEGYPNVWLGVTVENRRSGLRRMEQLRSIPAKVRFLSAEPLLEDLGELDLTGFHWLIIGGESGIGCRPMDPAWAESLIHRCREQGVSVFFKQTGGVNGGDCIIGGREIKEWPNMPQPRIALPVDNHQRRESPHE